MPRHVETENRAATFEAHILDTGNLVAAKVATVLQVELCAPIAAPHDEPLVRVRYFNALARAHPRPSRGQPLRCIDHFHHVLARTLAVARRCKAHFTTAARAQGSQRLQSGRLAGCEWRGRR